jgi:two-component system response regulator MprA
MLQRTLTYEGFGVLSASDGHQALAELQAHRPDVVVLDWLMPGLDGLGVLERLRAAGDKTLVLMLTARDAVEHRVEGLESGADDYLVKPFAPAELLARIHALLRRPAVAARDEALRYADLHLDPLTRETRRGPRGFELTAKEFDLLRFLMRHPRQVLSREQILQDVWSYDREGIDRGARRRDRGREPARPGQRLHGDVAGGRASTVLLRDAYFLLWPVSDRASSGGRRHGERSLTSCSGRSPTEPAAAGRSRAVPRPLSCAQAVLYWGREAGWVTCSPRFQSRFRRPRAHQEPFPDHHSA